MEDCKININSFQTLKFNDYNEGNIHESMDWTGGQIINHADLKPISQWLGNIFCPRDDVKLYTTHIFYVCDMSYN